MSESKHALGKPSHPYKIQREAENLALLSRDLATRSTAWRSRPTDIELSLNNHCNLVCVMCGKADDEPSQLMDSELAVRVLDELLPCALHLTPSANSEPFLNDMDLIGGLCRKHEVSLFLFTNGALCTEKRYRPIRDVVHKLWFSFDSHLPETYEKIRVNASFEAVLANIRSTLRLAEEDGTEITFQMVLMRHNARELPAYVRFVAGLGGTRIRVAELLPHSSAYHELKVEGAIEDAELAEILEEAKSAARELRVDLALGLEPPFGDAVKAASQPTRYKAPLATFRELYMEAIARIYPAFCRQAANYTKVTPDGCVYPCCRAPQSLLMGNVRDNSFEEIWNGEPYQEFRRQMIEGDYAPVCRSCYVR